LFSQRLFSLMGLGSRELLDGTKLPNVRLLRYVGLFNQRPHSASALGGLISDFFGQVPVRIQQCTGRWVSIRQEQRSSLGGRKCSLTRDCAIGARLFSPSAAFCISIGPLDYDSFAQFLPSRSSLSTFARLVLLVRLFVLDRLDFDVELHVTQSDIPAVRLSY